MRSTSLLAALLVAVVLGAAFLARRADEQTAGGTGAVTLVGDSLNVGVERYLPEALPGWTVVANDRIGRTTPEGIVELEADRARLSPHVVISLGTNDPPAAVAAFRRDVARVLELVGAGRCVVWATIWRDGAPSEAFNAVLRDAAAADSRVRLVEWAEMVEAHPDWLAGDGLHGNETGYRERARAIAAATTGCSPAETAKDR